MSLSAEPNASDIQATRSGGALIGEFFEVVDGMREPYRLVCPPELEILEQQRFVTCTADLASLIGRENIFPAASSDGSASEDRPLSGSSSDSYESRLLIREGQFGNFLYEYLRVSGKDSASVFDAGCGRARAFGEILAIDGVSREKSVGITAAGIRKVREEARDRVNFGNIIFLAPRRGEVETVRFNVLLSVHGALSYYPLNKIGGARYQMLAFLQAINFIEQNGLLLIDCMCAKEETVPFLVSKGILRRVLELEQFLRNGTERKTVFMLDRRPTIDEIREFLGIGAGNHYSRWP